MTPARVNKSELFSSLPPEWPEDLLPTIQHEISADGQKVIVLDDDPTGTQTVHSVPVLTRWPFDPLEQELAGESPVVYLLTNSRSMPIDQACSFNFDIGKRITTAAKSAAKPVVVVSRSDSTLRGHFPGEVDALARGLAQNFDAWLIIPFFIEGGRYTIDDIHYVAEGEWLVPAGETEFARDKAFGYQSSNLRDWVAEKTGGKVTADQVHSISISCLRQGGSQAVRQILLGLPQGAVCIVNAASYRDLEVLVAGLLDAEAAGKHYLYRTAASFVRVRAGIHPKPLLTAADLNLQGDSGGLVVAGSYVPKTSAQLERLIAAGITVPVEVNARRLLDETSREEEIHQAQAKINSLLSAGRDVCVYTSRELISTAGAEENLQIGQTISDGLISIVRGLTIRPRYLLAKGGITSSEVATKALEVQSAVVLGQVLAGVPVWRCGMESRFPGLPYIVFPGNVGSEDALLSVVSGLHKH